MGGVLAALAIVIMCLGSIVPIATYACPALCMLVGGILLRVCGPKITWAWYGVVAILSLLLCADMESAITFVIFGYYPILRPRLNRFRLSILWKLLYFNIIVLVLYTVLLRLMGMAHLLEEFKEAGFVGLTVMLLLGNLTFWLLDKLLGRFCDRS